MSNLKTFKQTLLKNGGASYGIYNGILNPKHGFMSSYKDSEEVHNPEGFNSETIKRYVYKHAEQLSEFGNYLGGWLFEDKIYLDVSKQFVNKEKALEFGKQNGQIAIFDNYTGEVINLKK